MPAASASSDSASPPPPALGVDFGERRIGLAVSQGTVAVPLETLERRTDRAAVGAIYDRATRHRCRVLVVGEPRGLDGSRGDAADRARRFGAKLEARCGLPVVFVNEALTSVEAEERLSAAGVDLRRNPKRIDAVAAQILLQEALDRGLVAAAAEPAPEAFEVPSGNRSRRTPATPTETDPETPES